jgi:hypothetical protein
VFRATYTEINARQAVALGDPINRVGGWDPLKVLHPNTEAASKTGKQSALIGDSI